MFAQYSMSPNLPSCPPMEHSYSTGSEDSVQSSMPFYYSYPPADCELLSQPTSSPSYAPSYASSVSASSFDSPSFSSCDFTPPLAYPAQQLQATNATYFAPMQPYCAWSADPAATAATAAAVASATAMAPMDEILIPELDSEADMVEMDLETGMEMDLDPYANSPKPMTTHLPMPMPMPVMSDLPTSPNSGAKLFSCTDCGRAFTRPADLKRHQTSVHNPVFQDCPVEACLRKDKNGFPRRDHLIEHLRSYHHWDVPKRRALKRGVRA